MNDANSQDDHADVREVLRRDALRVRKEPPFDAALHASTMRRVRALAEEGTATPPPRWIQTLARLLGGGQPGALVWAGRLAILVVVIGWWWHAPLSPRTSSPRVNVTKQGTHTMEPTASAPGRIASGPEHSQDGDSMAGQMLAASFDLGRFADADLRFAVLDDGLRDRCANRYHLESPAGPMRLGCAYRAGENGRNTEPFGKRIFRVDDQF